MKKRRIVVLYRENCGGVLRNLASGLRKTVTNIAEMDLYDDLRERIFRKETNSQIESQEKFSA